MLARVGSVFIISVVYCWFPRVHSVVRLFEEGTVIPAFRQTKLTLFAAMPELLAFSGAILVIMLVAAEVRIPACPSGPHACHKNQAP